MIRPDAGRREVSVTSHEFSKRYFWCGVIPQVLIAQHGVKPGCPRARRTGFLDDLEGARLCSVSPCPKHVPTRMEGCQSVKSLSLSRSRVLPGQEAKRVSLAPGSAFSCAESMVRTPDPASSRSTLNPSGLELKACLPQAVGRRVELAVGVRTLGADPGSAGPQWEG